MKAVLFDLDGVLIDTEGIYTEFWSGIDRRYPTGISNFAYAIKGTTLADILGRFFAEEVRQPIMDELKDFEQNMPYRLFPGALEVLQSLKSKGISTAIVTSSNREKMERVFAELPEMAKCIDTLVTDEDVTRSKPDPQGYLLAAERLGAKPGEFAVVEDSLHGLAAGRSSGGMVIGIATTNPRDKVEPLADYTFDTVAGLSTLSL